MHVLVAACLAGAAFAMVVPTAGAQGAAGVAPTLVVKLNPTSENVKPLQGPISFTGEATLTYDPSKASNVVGVPVSYKVTKQPAWASVVVSPATDVFATGSAPGASTSATQKSSFTVSVTASDQAPAFASDSIEITATASLQNPSQQVTAAQSTPIAAAYFGILDAQLAETIKVERPQTPVVFPLKVTNFGNGATKIKFAVTDKTENLNAPPPADLILQAKQTGGSPITAEVPLQIETPYKNGYMNEVGSVTYKLTSNYQFDAKQIGDTSTISVLITTKGFYVPGPEIPLVIGLLAIGALVLRRRPA
jgi:hypothetical protein